MILEVICVKLLFTEKSFIFNYIFTWKFTMILTQVLGDAKKGDNIGIYDGRTLVPSVLSLKGNMHIRAIIDCGGFRYNRY